jgi:xanthine dehydrogenase molybdenum-binding subunit
MPEGGIMGTPGVRLMDGYAKASGKNVYPRDVSRPGMLFAKFLLSPHAHARIVTMDTSAAEASPGVWTVIKWDDPDLAWINIQGNFGSRAEKTTDEVHFWGQPCGAIVVADTEAQVDDALKLIDIIWEVLPHVVDWDEALEPGAPKLRPDRNPDSNIAEDETSSHGDVAAALTSSTNVIEFTIKKDEDVWAGVEPNTCVAEWKDNELDVWVRTQNPDLAGRFLAASYPGIAGFWPGNAHAIRYCSDAQMHVHSGYIGAQFGGLEWLGYQQCFPALAVLCAKRTQKPVKFLFDYSNFHYLGEATGTYSYTIGFEDSGVVNAVNVEANFCGATIGKMYEGSSIPNQVCHNVHPFLNRGGSVCYNHGDPSTTVVCEVYNQVAAALGMDPTLVAEANDGCVGETMHHVDEHIKEPQGFDATRNSLSEVHAIGKAAIDWDNNYHEPGARLLPNGNYHGIGYGSFIQWDHVSGRTNTGLRLRADGSLNIMARHAGGGWHSESTWAQAVADESGVAYEDIVFRNADDVGFQARGGGGSSGMCGTLPSMARVGRKMKQVILEHATMGRSYGRAPLMGDVPIEECDVMNSLVFEKADPENAISVGTVAGNFAGGFWGGDNLYAWDYPPATSPPVQMEVMARQCYFQEVEVDPDTGYCQTTRFVVVNDVGKVINYDAAIGQQYGGCYMGIGRANTEAVYYDPVYGVKMNDNLIGYAVPVMNDCTGPIDCFLVETGFGYSTYGTYGLGESSGACASVMTNSAIYNALGVHVNAWPTTPDKVLKALGKV